MNKILLRVVMGTMAALFLFSSRDVSAYASLGQKNQAQTIAPDFSLETIAGKTVVLKDLKGKGVILFFFTTWCPYCRQKLPLLAKQYQKYQSDGLELLVTDVGESRAKVSSFATKEQLPFDILLDVDMKASEAYGVLGVPTFILISKDGLVAYEGNEMPSNYQELLNK